MAITSGGVTYSSYSSYAAATSGSGSSSGGSGSSGSSGGGGQTPSTPVPAQDTRSDLQRRMGVQLSGAVTSGVDRPGDSLSTRMQSSNQPYQGQGQGNQSQPLSQSINKLAVPSIPSLLNKKNEQQVNSSSFNPEVLQRMRTPQPGSIAKQNLQTIEGYKLRPDVQAFVEQPLNKLAIFTSSPDVMVKQVSNVYYKTKNLFGFSDPSGNLASSTKELKEARLNVLWDIKQTREQKGIYGGVALKTIEHPIVQSVAFGAAFKVGIVGTRMLLKGAASKVSSMSIPIVSNVGSKALGFGEKLIEPGATAIGVGMIGYDVAKSKNVGEGLGKTFVIGASLPGAIVGYKAAGQVITGLKTYGKQTIPISDIVPPKVLSGKESFPMTDVGTFRKYQSLFDVPKTNIKAGYHVTSEAWIKEGAIVKSQLDLGIPLRAKDVPGAYISPYKSGASIHFAGLETSKGYGFKNILQSEPLNPEITLIKGVKGIERIPEGIHVPKSRQFLSSEKPKLGTGYIEPKIEMGRFKGEAQAVLAKGTQFGTTISEKRVLYKGKYIPFSETIIKGSKQTSIAEGIKTFEEGKLTTNMKKIFSEKSMFESTSPSRYLASSGMSKLLTSSKSTPSRSYQKSSITSSFSSPFESSPSSRSSSSSRIISSYKPNYKSGYSGYSGSGSPSKSSITSSITSSFSSPFESSPQSSTTRKGSPISHSSSMYSPPLLIEITKPKYLPLFESSVSGKKKRKKTKYVQGVKLYPFGNQVKTSMIFG